MPGASWAVRSRQSASLRPPAPPRRAVDLTGDRWRPPGWKDRIGREQGGLGQVGEVGSGRLPKVSMMLGPRLRESARPGPPPAARSAARRAHPSRARGESERGDSTRSTRSGCDAGGVRLARGHDRYGPRARPGPSTGPGWSAVAVPAGRRHARRRGPRSRRASARSPLGRRGLPSVRAISTRVSGSRPALDPSNTARSCSAPSVA